MNWNPNHHLVMRNGKWRLRYRKLVDPLVVGRDTEMTLGTDDVFEARRMRDAILPTLPMAKPISPNQQNK